MLGTKGHVTQCLCHGPKWWNDDATGQKWHVTSVKGTSQYNQAAFKLIVRTVSGTKQLITQSDSMQPDWPPRHQLQLHLVLHDINPASNILLHTMPWFTCTNSIMCVVKQHNMNHPLILQILCGAYHKAEILSVLPQAHTVQLLHTLAHCCKDPLLLWQQRWATTLHVGGGDHCACWRGRSPCMISRRSHTTCWQEISLCTLAGAPHANAYIAIEPLTTVIVSKWTHSNCY